MNQAPSSQPSPNDPYAPFRIRDYRLLMATVFMLAFVYLAQGVAIGWDLYERTGSALALGMVGLLQFAPVILLFLPAGQLADRHDRRRMMALSLPLTEADGDQLVAAVEEFAQSRKRLLS